MRVRLVAAILFLIGGCHADQGDVATAASLTCKAQGEVHELADILKAHQAIVVGEHHGTNEMPAAFVQIVDEASQNGARITVALEYEEDWQDVLDAVMAASSDEGALSAFSQQNTGDGRTSPAMRHMLLSLRALIKSGRDIHVVGVDYWPHKHADGHRTPPEWIPAEVDTQRAARDIAMGELAVAACQLVDCDVLAYYAGNMHSREQIAESFTYNTETGVETQFTTMPAGAVIAHNMSTASVYLSHRGGAAKAQMAGGFKAWSIKANTPDYVGKDGVFYCAPDESHHDYFLSVGTVSPSSNPD